MSSSNSASSRSISSSRRSSSSSEDLYCYGDECELEGDEYCSQYGKFCYATPNPPCIQCVTDNTSSRSYPWISSRSRSRSARSNASSLSWPDHDVCQGDECGLGGDAYCAQYGLFCATIADQPCIECTDAPASSSRRSSPFIITYDTSSDSSALSCVNDENCPEGLRCINEICLTREQLAALPDFCGNARIDSGETCDNGSMNSNLPNALCRSDCTPGRCGDGILDTPLELCDDGNNLPQDGCSAGCQPERSGPIAQEALPASIIELPFAPSQVPTYSVSPSTVAPQLPFPPQNTDSGPAAIIIMVSGAAAGWAWMRRRR